MNSERALSNPVRKKHCMIVHAYYPLGETRVQREAEALLQHGYEVDVICLRGKNQPAQDTAKGVNIYRLPVKRSLKKTLTVQLLEYLFFFFLAMLKVFKLHWQQGYKVIQLHNPPDFLVFSAWLPKLFGARVILDLHDLMPEFYMGRFQQGKNSFSVRLICLQERLACGFADSVITVSHHWRQALIARGVAAEKINVVMNVADDRIFFPSPTPKHPEADGALRLIYHGTVTQRYGLDLVLQAMAKLRRQAPELHLTILGDGDDMDALMQLAQDLSLDSQVTFCREMRPAEDLPAFILAADAGIVPYRNDPFTDTLVPTKLLEYAALGLPSIAARTTAISEYFDDTMVKFFSPGSVDDLTRCLLTLYTNRAQLAQLAVGIQKFNQQYRWTDISAAYLALVEKLGA